MAPKWFKAMGEMASALRDASSAVMGVVSRGVG